jgi:hypothetical protein
VKIDPTALYLCDNGACCCGEHLGMTAKATGHDISGQKIIRITRHVLAESGGAVFQCEDQRNGKRCERSAS